MDKLKEALANLKNKIKENREPLIRIGGMVVGAAIGAGITYVVLNALSENYIDVDEIISSDENLLMPEEA